MSEVDSLGAYLHHVGRFPLLSAEEEVEIARTIEEGRLARDRLLLGPKKSEIRRLERVCSVGERARAQFINSNLRLVVMLARRYTTGELDLVDVIQLGNIGLIRAVDKFDWRRGYRFSTHATWWVRQSIGVGIEQTAGVIRIPRSAREELHLIQAAKKLAPSSGGTPSVDDIARWSGMKSKRVSQVLSYPREVTSLEAPVLETQSRHDLIADQTIDNLEGQVEKLAAIKAVNDCLSILCAQEREVLSRRFGLKGFEPHTIAEISASMHLTESAASRHLKKALIEVKSHLTFTLNED